MKLHDDFTTLSWVKGELDETLKQARQALEAGNAIPKRVAKSNVLFQITLKLHPFIHGRN